MRITTTARLALAAGLGLAAPLAPLGAAAQDVQLFHDKGFWSAQLQTVGDAAQAATGVRIVETPYSTAEQYKAFVQSSIASGETPSMFTWWTGSTFRELVETGQVAPLDDLWKTMLDSGAYQPGAEELFMVDGHPYGVPMVLARWVVLYDKAAFADAGIDAPPATWDELMADAAALKDHGHTPFLATLQEGWRGFIWFQELMLRTDPQAYLGLHDGTVAYDSEPVRHAFEIWSKMYADGWFSDPRSEQEVADFVSGKGAMYLIGEWAVGLVETAGFDEANLGVFVMPNAPGVDEASVIVEGGPIVVSTEGAQDPDVMKALTFWVSQEGAASWGAASGNYIGNDQAPAPNAVVGEVNGLLAASHAKSYLRWWEAVPPDLQGELVAELNGFMLDPTMDNAETVMANMQALNAAYWADQ